MAVFSGTGLDDLCLSLEELAVLNAIPVALAVW